MLLNIINWINTNCIMYVRTNLATQLSIKLQKAIRRLFTWFESFKVCQQQSKIIITEDVC